MVKHTGGDQQPSEEKPPQEQAAKFTKQQFLGSSKYAQHQDVLNALLKDDQTYTTEKVNQLLDGFLEKEAK